jgi:hypothetical protein
VGSDDMIQQDLGTPNLQLDEPENWLAGCYAVR